MSLYITLNPDLKQHNRQTYSLLDWLGDCGGLLDALKAIGETLISPLSLFALQSKLASLIVYFRPSESKGNHDEFASTKTAGYFFSKFLTSGEVWT